MIKQNWEIFSSKFENKEEIFEWFSYLLFCREFNLPKGWFGFKNQSAIEKEPIQVNDEFIGFQAKFYTTSLSDHKDDFLEMLVKARRDYPSLTKILIYTNKSWSQAYSQKEKKQTEPQALKDIQSKAEELEIELVWREASFFESEFVCLENDDLSRYFFTEHPMQGWQRFNDWSNTKAKIEAEYFVDENVKVISPNHHRDNGINVIDGINEIREKLNKGGTSVRLVGLSGVGKTRFSQALFDERIGEKSLDHRNVWYCDLGDSPTPLPEHFIDELIKKHKPFILIVDNCGQDTHANLTKNIKETQISLLTIEYDIKDDLPENTEVYKLKPISEEIVKRVVDRHYPDISDLTSRKIAEFSGGNYRLALAIASNIGKTDNISVLTDGQLFERLFWQQGQKNDDLFKIAQIFSLVYSFNIEDSGTENSELDFLARLVGVNCDTAIEAIETLKQKDIIQQRGQWRAILPHAVANRLAKELISKKLVSQLDQYCQQMPQRLQRSFIKRLSYLHDQPKVQDLVKSWFKFDGWLGQKLLDDTYNEQDLVYIRLLGSIDEEQLLSLFEAKNYQNPDFLTRKNAQYVEISRLLRCLAYHEQNFKRAFDLLLIFSKDEKEEEKSNSIRELITSLFRLYTSESLANLEMKKEVINELNEKPEYQSLLLKVLRTALNFHEYGYVLKGSYDDGKLSSYGYQPQTHEERLGWVDFLLNILNQLDIKGVTDARNIFVCYLKEIIWTCGQIDLVKSYLKKFNERDYFSKAHNRLLNIIKYNIDRLTNAPQFLLDLQDLEKYLRPRKFNVTELIRSYILVPDHDLYRLTKNSDDKDAIEIPNFDNYEDLIAYISNELKDINKLSSNIDLLISANSGWIENNYLKKLGEDSAKVFIDVNQCIKTLDAINIDKNLLRSSEFLLGILNGFKIHSLDEFHYLIEFMIKNEKFKNTICLLILQNSKSDDDFLYFSQLIRDRKIEIINFPRISASKYHQRISNYQFEILIDALIYIGDTKEVLYQLLEECFFQKSVAEKYISILLENLHEILANENPYDHSEDALKFLLSLDTQITDQIFEIYKNLLKEEKYLSLYEHDKKFRILKVFITHSTLKFINFFCEDEYFLNNFFFDSLSKILVYAKEQDVLDWIGDDQQNLKFWIENSQLLITKDNNEVIWVDYLTTLLDRSDSPHQTLEEIIHNNIFRSRSSVVYSGSWSDVMKQKLPYITSLKIRLKDTYPELLPLINKKEQDWLKQIDIQSLRDDEESKRRSERFDW